MCKYCDLFEEHKPAVVAASKLIEVSTEQDGTKQGCLWSYLTGMLVAQFCPDPIQAGRILQEAFAAGYRRGHNTRTQKLSS